MEVPPDQQSLPRADALHPLWVTWLALVVAFCAGVVAWVAALAMPSYAYGPLGDGPTGLAPSIYQLACMGLPLVGVGGVALSRWKRLPGQLLVALAGFGTCAVAVMAVVLAGPNQNSFLPLGEGASPGTIATCAVIATAAALTMVVASAIDTR